MLLVCGGRRVGLCESVAKVCRQKTSSSIYLYIPRSHCPITIGNIEITGPAQNEVIDSGMLVRLKCQLEVEQSMTGTIMYTWSREGGLLPNNSFQDGNGEFNLCI